MEVVHKSPQLYATKEDFPAERPCNPTHQWDVECHDQSMEKLEVLPTGGRGRYYEHGQQYSYKRMKHSMKTRFSTVVEEELPVVENRRNSQSAPPKQENTATLHCHDWRRRILPTPEKKVFWDLYHITGGKTRTLTTRSRSMKKSLMRLKSSCQNKSRVCWCFQQISLKWDAASTRSRSCHTSRRGCLKDSGI